MRVSSVRVRTQDLVRWGDGKESAIQKLKYKQKQ